MTSKLSFQIAGAIAVLAAMTSALRPLERRLGDASSQVPRGEQLAAISVRSDGGALTLLGGLRAVVAGACWLKANLAWERCDRDETLALIHVTVAADERPRYFWLNGARMIAYDMPEWRRGSPAPIEVERWWREAHARLALEFLEKGVRWQGKHPDFYVEMANIHLRKLGDVETASRYYRLASELPASPSYTGRIYGEMLREMGRKGEALQWLRTLLQRLPNDEPTEARAVVEQRIRLLERELDGLL